ncbi:MAG: DMT family transporter [Caldilineaceae bacterium]|nr:DMT family transporter [Caldilineaceae bacterium]
MDRRQIIADLTLLLVVTLWGATFVMVQDAVREWPVFAFLALRFAIAAAAFAPIFLWRRRRGGKEENHEGTKSQRGILIPAIVIGLVLGASYAFQTVGLLYTTPAKTGFITGLNVILVPVGAALFLRQRAGAPVIVGVLLATIGLGLLSLNDDLSIGFGDFLVFICALAVAAQILLVSRYAPRVSPFRLAGIQIATMAVACAIISLIFEVPGGLPPLSGSVLFAAAFTGLLATTFAFTAQAWAQRFTSASHIALLFTLEPVTAAIASYLLIGEVLTVRALLGCALILAGMLAAELGGLWLAARRKRVVFREALPVPGK